MNTQKQKTTRTKKAVGLRHGLGVTNNNYEISLSKEAKNKLGKNKKFIDTIGLSVAGSQPKKSNN